jgi:hypothetical protein
MNSLNSEAPNYLRRCYNLEGIRSRTVRDTHKASREGTVPCPEPLAEHGWTVHSAKLVDENEVDTDQVEDDDGDDGQAVNMKDENEIELDFVLDYAGDDSGQSDANKKPRMEH